MAKGHHQDHRRITMAVSVIGGRLNKPLHLIESGAHESAALHSWVCGRQLFDFQCLASQVRLYHEKSRLTLTQKRQAGKQWLKFVLHIDPARCAVLF
jgi:hypothetical protein